jgi:hypothetical protein
MRHVDHVNPRNDADFAALVDGLAADADTPQDLEHRLQDTHPNVVVRPRGLSGEPVETWYVYRDGSWTSEDS